MNNRLKLILCVSAIAVTLNVFAGHGWKRVNYTNSTIFTGIVTINGIPADSGDVIGIFVDGECRMVSPVFMYGGKAYVSAVLHGEKTETATIKYWSSKKDKVFDIDTTITTSPSNEVLQFPIKLKTNEVSTVNNRFYNENTVAIYPTVAKSSITINTSSEINNITIIDNIGNKVMEIAELNNNHVDISSLANGVYFVSVNLKDGSVNTKKIVKN